MEAGVYPGHLETDVVVRDGSTVHVRPVRPEDEAALAAFLGALSDESRWMRFFGGGTNIGRAGHAAADVDYLDRYGVIALSGSGGQIVGHAEYIRRDAEAAEIAFEVADSEQGRGLATILLAHLASAAAENDIPTFHAVVLPHNHRMIDVFRQSGYPVTTHAGSGEITVELPTSVGEAALEAFDHRDQVAAVAAVATFLRPVSVAVIGASRNRGTVGGEIFHNLVSAGFHGHVYPVNPSAEMVQSVRAYPEVGELPEVVDLGVIAVPGEYVIDVARQCGEKGVRALVIVSAGFAETGPEGVLRQAELLRVCREHGMRLVGPNCLGVLNTDPGISLNATFAPAFPNPGNVAFLSQSGALGLALVDSVDARGLGLSSFVSVGDKADISSNDLLNYWEEDDRTKLILLYLESFGNPRRFARIARRVSRSKPIVAVKSGRTPAGARATSSHTGALISASDVNVDALFRQSGVVRTETLGELLDVASLLATQPVPEGGRVGILTNSGGPGIMCADAAEAEGLEVAELSEATRAALRDLLPAEASLSNPVDMLAEASGDQYKGAILAVAADEAVDAIVVIFTPARITPPEEIGRAVHQAAAELPRGVPLVSVFISAAGAPPELNAEEPYVPALAFPEEAMRALGHAARYGAWRKRDPGSVPELAAFRPAEATIVIAEALGRGPGWLTPQEVNRLLDCYEIPCVESRLVPSAPAAGSAAEELGGSVVLKVVSPSLLHKTEAGGVRVGLLGGAAVEDAAREIGEAVESAGHDVEGFLVQPQVEGGVEMLVGVVNDPLFGPVVACGAGGVTAELLKDVAVRLTPVTDRDASEMIRSLASFPLLDGYRGAAPADVASLEQLILRVSALVDAHPELVEMDCNPVLVGPTGAVVVDARVRVEASALKPPWAARVR